MLIFFRNLSLPLKLSLAIMLLMIIGPLARVVVEYTQLQSAAQQVAFSHANQLNEYHLAVEKIYQNQFFQSGLALNESTKGFLPAHAAPLIAEAFSESSSLKTNVRRVSERPRNPSNATNDIERLAIEYFKSNPEAKDWIKPVKVDDTEIFFYATPIRLQGYCILCHGDRSSAPAFIQQNYDQGYEYSVGDLIGVTSVSINQRQLIDEQYDSFYKRVVMTLFIVGVLIGLSALMVTLITREQLTVTAKLLALSTTDQLTGLVNRRRLDEDLSVQKGLNERYGDLFSIIIVDIDYFKSVNDEHGHLVGDAVLQTIARLLSEGVRKTDVVGRWGGEEFLIICPKTDLAQAMHVAENLRQKIEHHTFAQVGQKTASFGVSSIQIEESLESIIHRADLALYAAKESGRNTVVG
jgi:diguanylate cyclase (GGDEF)-like protein